MQQHKNNTCIIKGQQQGSVLVISLVVLVLMTIIAVAALNSNTIQTTMAGGSQAQITALGAAESELPKVEAALGSAIVLGDPTTTPPTATTSTCTTVGAQDVPFTASLDAYYTKPSNVSYVISCVDRKTIQQTVLDTTTNTYVITPSGTCIDTYKIELTDSSGKGTQRVVESQFAINDVAC